MKRKIGEYVGQEPGPLVICIAGIHGNEHAGINALEMVLEMLESEPIKNPDFVYKGKFVAIRGNLAALQQKSRFIDKDLNRNFLKERIEDPKTSEDREAREIITFIKEQIAAYKADKLLIIDLHTTSSPGGIFTIVQDNHQSLDIAKSMHAPIIMGIDHRVKGTTIQYFTTENLGVLTKAIVFESGQHDDPNAVIIAIAAVIAALRTLGSVEPHDVESYHDKILIDFSRNLPALTKFVGKHSISKEDDFKMKPGFKNFQSVKKGEIVATDKNGDIVIPEDGILLMPLYQSQGEDGFFLIQKIEENEVH